MDQPTKQDLGPWSHTQGRLCGSLSLCSADLDQHSLPFLAFRSREVAIVELPRPWGINIPKLHVRNNNIMDTEQAPHRPGHTSKLKIKAPKPVTFCRQHHIILLFYGDVFLELLSLVKQLQFFALQRGEGKQNQNAIIPEKYTKFLQTCFGPLVNKYWFQRKHKTKQKK